MTRALRMASGAVLLVLALACALIASASRSDFMFRGCADIPRGDWDATANCSDAWFAQAFFGGLGVMAFVSALLAWRWRARA